METDQLMNSQSIVNNPSIISNEAMIATILCLVFMIINLIVLAKLDLIRSLFNMTIQAFPLLNFFRINNNPHNENQQNGYVYQRVVTEDCCICLSQIVYQVAASCGHVFCGKCISELWESRNRQKVRCPLDRRDISMLILDFEPNEEAFNDPVRKKIIQDVKLYNMLYSNHPRTISQIIFEAPFLLRRFTDFLFTRQGWIFMLRKILSSLYIALLLVYIISPFDLIPDYIPIIGWLDDLIVIIYILLYVSILYFEFLRAHN